MLAEGKLDLKWLLVGEEPVAVQYNFLKNKTVYFYQSGRKMDVPDNIRIGIVMHALSMQEMMQRGFAEYDFMGGEATYKQRFTSTTRELVDIRIALRSPKETARLAVESGVGLLRKAKALTAGALSKLKAAPAALQAAIAKARAAQRGGKGAGIETVTKAAPKKAPKKAAPKDAKPPAKPPAKQLRRRSPADQNQ